MRYNCCQVEGERRMIVYRSGARTSDNFTPRLGKDTVAQAGKPPGLSTFNTLVALHLPSGGKAQKLDLELLKPPLQWFLDDPTQGGNPGHVAITPATPGGDVDQPRLEEWAACRRTETLHPFTQIVLDCIMETDMRS